MSYRKPEELIRSYLSFLFADSLAWPFYKCGCYTDYGEKTAEGLRKAYRRRYLTNASIYIEKKANTARERIDYQKRAEEVIRNNIARDEETMKAIVADFNDVAEVPLDTLWNQMAEKYQVATSGSKLGDELSKISLYNSGIDPNGKPFSDNMKRVIEEQLRPDTENELSFMCQFMRDYLESEADPQ